MGELRNVIVELQYARTVANNAFEAMVAPATEEVGLATKAAPRLEGLQVDKGFAPVALPGQKPREHGGPLDLGPFYTVEAEPRDSSYLVRGTVDEDDIDTLQAAAAGSESVVQIYSDVTVQPQQRICPGDPPRGDHHDVARLLCVPRLHELNLDGRGVLAAVVDTGINLAHLQAQGSAPRFDQARSWVPRAGLTPGQLPVGHGTMVAFDVMIAAPQATLLDIALLQSQAQGRNVMEGFLSDALRAYRHLIDIMEADRRPGEGASMVVNNSWGMFHPSWDFPVGHPGNYSDNPNHPFNRIVATLATAGADILFAAGNCGADCPDGRCRGVVANVIYGANSHADVLSVAGVDTQKDRVGYSSIGPGRLEDRKPDIASYTHFDGSKVYPADGGTSAACPVAAGVVAAVRSRLGYNPADPGTWPAAVRTMIIKTAEEAGAVGYDYEYGWGIINGCRLADRLADPEEPDDDKPRKCVCECVCRWVDDVEDDDD